MYHYPWCHHSFSFLHFTSSCLPACFRSETRIILMKLKFKTCRIHSTWNTFNPNLPRRISSPTFDADVVVIRCQSALLCRSIILKHVYFLEAIASLGLTFSLGHSVTHSVTNLQFLQERWLTTYFQEVNYLENSMICKYIWVPKIFASPDWFLHFQSDFSAISLIL